MATLVLTVIGDDRPGLVDALSGVISDHAGNWEESRMAHLANKFAGIVLVNVPDPQVDDMLVALRVLGERESLHITAERSGAEPPARATAAQPGRLLSLDLVGQDHPGIVHDITHALAGLGVSIEELDSVTESASMGGGVLFRATLKLWVPADVAGDKLRALLEGLANELMVDISMDATQ